MPNVNVTATIPYEDWQHMNQLIKDDQFKNISQFIREAVRDKIRSSTRVSSYPSKEHEGL